MAKQEEGKAKSDAEAKADNEAEEARRANASSRDDGYKARREAERETYREIENLLIAFSNCTTYDDLLPLLRQGAQLALKRHRLDAPPPANEA